MNLPGVGPISAAQLLISWSHRGRLRSEGAFATLAGAAPIPASSGLTNRHRLNRGVTANSPQRGQDHPGSQTKPQKDHRPQKCSVSYNNARQCFTGCGRGCL
jgi:hypothetical protein